MRKLKVGIWLEDEYSPEEGGGFGYYNQLISELNNYKFNDAEIIFISKIDYSSIFKNIYVLKTKMKKVDRPGAFVRAINFALKLLTKGKIYIDYKNETTINQSIKRELNEIVDVIYYVKPGFCVDNFPYIYTIWDLGHCLAYGFPEVTSNGIFEYRKNHYDHVPQKAMMVFSESNAGKLEIVKYLKINENKIKIIPIFPSEIINAEVNCIKPSNISNGIAFIHYPAQFWSHKNHFNLLLAFKEVLKGHNNLKLILTGSDKGNKNYILSVITDLGLIESVIDMGFVSINELKWIYLNSYGLVMPSLLGPTNMPLLEAAELNCPVACSNLAGHIEQLGDYAYYFDPLDYKEIAHSILVMIDEKKEGIVRKYESKFNIQNALSNIDLAFSELRNIRFCWGKED